MRPSHKLATRGGGIPSTTMKVHVLLIEVLVFFFKILRFHDSNLTFLSALEPTSKDEVGTASLTEAHLHSLYWIIGELR